MLVRSLTSLLFIFIFQLLLGGRYYGSHQYTVNEQVLIHLDGRDLKWCQ